MREDIFIKYFNGQFMNLVEVKVYSVRVVTFKVQMNTIGNIKEIGYAFLFEMQDGQPLTYQLTTKILKYIYQTCGPP